MWVTAPVLVMSILPQSELNSESRIQWGFRHTEKHEFCGTGSLHSRVFQALLFLELVITFNTS